MIGLQNSHHFSPHAFSRLWRQLHVFALNSDWLAVLFTSVAIGQSNYFGFGFTTTALLAEWLIIVMRCSITAGTYQAQCFCYFAVCICEDVMKRSLRFLTVCMQGSSCAILWSQHSCEYLVEAWCASEFQWL